MCTGVASASNDVVFEFVPQSSPCSGPQSSSNVAIQRDSDQIAKKKILSETSIYAIFDSNDDLQFIGLSRNIAASVLAHPKSVPELHHPVKIMESSMA